MDLSASKVPFDVINDESDVIKWICDAINGGSDVINAKCDVINRKSDMIPTSHCSKKASSIQSMLLQFHIYISRLSLSNNMMILSNFSSTFIWFAILVF